MQTNATETAKLKKFRPTAKYEHVVCQQPLRGWVPAGSLHGHWLHSLDSVQWWWSSRVCGFDSRWTPIRLRSADHYSGSADQVTRRMMLVGERWPRRQIQPCPGSTSAQGRKIRVFSPLRVIARKQVLWATTYIRIIRDTINFSSSCADCRRR